MVELEFALPRDTRLAAQLADHATGAAPAWVWSTDGLRILWANAVGAAIFGAANASECVTRPFAAKHPAAREIIRLAATLPPAGQARLERLRGFGARFGRALTCVCSRFQLADGSAAILVIATEPAGPPLALGERVSRLFSDRAVTPIAVFAPDGTCVYANEAAQTRSAGTPTLSALGIDGLAAEALKNGSGSGATAHGPVSVQRLGSDASTVIVATFGVEGSGARPAESAAAKIEPASLGTAAQARVGGLPPSPPAGPAAVAPAQAAAQAARRPLHDEPIAERRHPLRFVWQMDADGRFVVGSDEFTELMGPQTTSAFGRLWSEVAAELRLDPEHQVTRAVATHETWSGITISWPVAEGEERLPVELSGLPVFDRERKFRGYRGFGVCRDIVRINQLAHARRERPIGFMARPEPPPESDSAAAATPQGLPTADTTAAAASPPAAEAAVAARSERATPSVAPAAANVVMFRPGMPEPKAPSLSPVERKAFRELAQELTARLHGGREPLPAEPDKPALADPQAAPPEISEQVGSQPEQVDAPQPQTASEFEPGLLDRIPVGVLIYQNDALNEVLLYANRHFLELSSYPDLEALVASGGLKTLLAESGAGMPGLGGGAQALSLATAGGERREVEGRLFPVPWGKASALALILTNGEAAEQRRATALSLSAAENEIRDLATKLETAKKTEEELRGVAREAQKAAASKAEFLGKVSHEIRTPLNAITGFTEVIMAERFGPIGNERYREYLKDVHAAGMHLVALLNDLLDLSKIETGQLGLTFANVSLNELTQQCVGIMQPQASHARIIIRTALAPALPKVVADERSLRQIVLNLLSNSIKFTGPGGQVIVSTAFADSGEAVLRVRDTGVGMSEKDVEAALEPFRQTATAGSWGSGGTGLGLPLTKALAEANRAHFSIKSAPNAGTLIEVAFPPARVVAQ
jgi:signal transduction histidine kinase/PAS domain-containing protein